MPPEAGNMTFYFLDEITMFSLDDWLKVSSLSSEEDKKLSCVVTLTKMEGLGIQTCTFRS